MLDGVSPGPDGNIDIITLFSRQDDEGIYGEGAVLKAMQDPRAHLHILCMTLDQTSDAIKNLKITPDHSGRIRVKELESAAAAYGADEVIQFKYPSRTLPKNDPEKVVSEIRGEINRAHAEVVLTHDPAGFTGHWDHVACSKLATETFRLSNAQVLYYPTLPQSIYRIVAGFQTYHTHGAGLQGGHQRPGKNEKTRLL